MSDAKIFAKSKSSELQAELEQAFKKSKPHSRVKVVLKKIVANIILNNNELAHMYLQVVALMKLDDIEIRKLCFHYIVNYAHLVDAATACEAIPFCQRFVQDGDATLRALTIRTVSSVATPKAFVDLAFSHLGRLLRDPDPYVRRTALFAVSKLYHAEPHRTVELKLIDELNALLYDHDPAMTTNALAALSFITEQQQGPRLLDLSLTIDAAHAVQLASLLNRSNEWGQIYILNALSGSFVPQHQAEALDVIDRIIPALLHQNTAVVLDSVKCIIYLSNFVKSPELVMPQLLKRLGASIVSLLYKQPEIQFLVLRNVILLLLGRRGLCHFNVEMFFCKYDDPNYIKDTKLEIIYLQANAANAAVVLRELEEYATEVDVSMARKAIRAIGNLAVKIPSASARCVDVIVDLMSSGIPYVIQEAAIVIKNILRKYPAKFNYAIDDLLNHYDCIDELDSKIAVIWILGHYCREIEQCHRILEDMTSTFLEEPTEVQHVCLTSVTKYYLQNPQRGEALMLQVLRWATEDVENPDVRDRAFFYWRLLSSDDGNQKGAFQAHAKQIVLNNDPTIVTDNDNIDLMILEELELNIGTLASIYLKPVQLVFRLAKKKQLAVSPALQPRPTVRETSDDSADESHSSYDTRPRSMDSQSTGDKFAHRASRLGRMHPGPSDTSLDSPDIKENARESFAKKLTRKASTLGRKSYK